MYGLKEFSELRKRLNGSLMDQSGAPLSCCLYECKSARGSLSVINEAGDELACHVAEACNIASLINSLERILSLPRSNIACSEISEIFLLTLDVLREYIRAATVACPYHETQADKTIRAWAGFIKHPKDYVFAHICLSEFHEDSDPHSATITSQFLRNWDGLNNRQKDEKKAALADCIVVVELPSIDEISEFFDSCAKHLQALINAADQPT